jgi:phytol kinase
MFDDLRSMLVLDHLWSLLVPDLPTALWSGAFAGSVALVVGSLAAYAHRRGVAVPYTRKIFHFGIFTGAAVTHSLWGLPGTNAFGAVLACVVLVAVLRGDRDPIYRVLARETDRPRRTMFILLPLFTTALGGLASALLTGPYATVGYLVSGWGDAVGEPVGTRWGKHKYRVPSLGGVPATRSLEGSAAVFLVGWAAATLALWNLADPWRAVLVGLACAAVGALAEGLSNHGFDNLTVQLAASGTAWMLMS